jgi:thioredoxin-dependent peroxiredoxin
MSKRDKSCRDVRFLLYTIQTAEAAFSATPNERCFAAKVDPRMTMNTILKEGDKAPDFELPTDGGGRFRLSKQRGAPVVIYFYPKDDTSGCTMEAIDFTASKAAFDRLKTQVVGISPDAPNSHDKFKAKHKLSITLAADEEKIAANAYGVWAEKSMYGRKYMGVKRSTFLVDANGAIAKAWLDVKVPGHVDEVLAAAKALVGKTGKPAKPG